MDTQQLRISFPPVSFVRDQRLDFLRGVCVAAFVVDHIGGFSPLYLLTGGGNFYVTAAEGFVCISGFLVGGVYRKLVERRNSKAIWQRAAIRALFLYVLMVFMTAVVVLEGRALGVAYWYPLEHDEGLSGFLFRVATFRYWMHHTRILGMYSVLLLWGPLVIELLRRGATVFVLAASWVVYLVYQVSPSRFSWPFPVEAGFHPYAYQLLFTHCVALGYHQHRVRELFAPELGRKLFVASVVGMVLLVGTYLWHTEHPERAALLSKLFDRAYLRPGRILATGFLATAAFIGVTWLRERLDGPAARFLVVLGRYSLFCYAVHLPVVVVSDWISPSFQGQGALTLALNLVAQLVVLTAVWGLSRARETLLPVRWLQPMRYGP